MGNSGSISVKQNRPQQFLAQAHMDWNSQMQELYSHRPTLTKTVILPPGVELNDPRLAEGVVVSEKKYILDKGSFPLWPENQAFECDVDGRLLPPCWGEEKVHAHFAVYPDKYFPELNCGYCDLHKKVYPDKINTKIHQTKATVSMNQEKQTRRPSDESHVSFDTTKSTETPYTSLALES